ncbi:MAG TPA: hypothetical protein PKE40_01170 [Arachnia sp.]|nr:hypothetical protein [Arachnia sp.]HMT84938.1 hypothetical protein [Arachnia sp.]
MRVFISWAHSGEDWTDERAQLWEDHVEYFARLLAASDGAEVTLDLWFANDPDVNWNNWGPNQIDKADFVLVMLNEPWAQRWSGTNSPTRGAGATAEANALHGLFKDDQHEFQQKVRLVRLPDWPTDPVPRNLSGVKVLAAKALSPEGIESIIREIKNDPLHPRPEGAGSQQPTVPAALPSAISTFRDDDMLLLRFRNLHAGIATLDEHTKVIVANSGHGAWWGWWKKPREDAQLPLWDTFRERLSRSRGLVGLFNSGSRAGDVTRALAVEVLPPQPNEFDDTPPFTPPPDEWSSIPEYYRPTHPEHTQSCAWIRLVGIDTGPCQFYGDHHFVSNDPKYAGVVINKPDTLLD